MGSLALDGYINIVQLRCSVGNFARCAADIHAIAVISLNPALVHVYYAQAADFLADGKAQLHVTVSYAVLFKCTYRLQHGSNANLVVTAQSCGAVAIQNAVFANNLGAGCRCYGIHVRFEQQLRSIRHGALYIGPHIAAGTAGFFVRLIHLRLQAKLAQLRHNQLCFLLFILAGAGNAYQLYKFINQSCFVYHYSHLVVV